MPQANSILFLDITSKSCLEIAVINPSLLCWESSKSCMSLCCIVAGILKKRTSLSRPEHFEQPTTQHITIVTCASIWWTHGRNKRLCKLDHVLKMLYCHVIFGNTCFFISGTRYATNCGSDLVLWIHCKATHFAVCSNMCVRLL